MGAEQARRRDVSPVARKKCIERARKEVKFLDTWGRWAGTVYIAGGLTFFGLGIAFIVLLQHFVQMPGNPQQVQNNMWNGFMLGMVLGTIVFGLLFNGAFNIGEGISYLRGKPESRILVEYHDVLVDLLDNQGEDSLPASESDA